jgi:formylglycine-generating enzyme required for sulfatase activity
MDLVVTINWKAVCRNTGLLICLVLIMISSRQCVRLPLLKKEPARDFEQIQQLALTGNPSLAEVLDQKMIFIPSGSFLMGSDTGRNDEQPRHWVTLDAFKINQFEVTNIQYQRFIKETGTTPPRYWSGEQFPAGQEIHPVVGVRWKDANAYCTWAEKRLPTEAEWEKACRGSDGLIYPWGNHPNSDLVNVNFPVENPNPMIWDNAWAYLKTSSRAGGQPGLDPVGSYPGGVSPYGIFDMIGNASEWTADYYNWDGYWDLPSHNPLVLEPEWNHVLRGSAWLMPYGETLAGHDLNRCSVRSSSHGDNRDARMGFRCAESTEE